MTMNEERHDTPRESWSTVAMRQLVTAWLDGSPLDESSLRNWLIGDGLPAVSDSVEPYAWILRGLPPGARRYAYESALAARAAALLDEAPEVTADPERERFVYNLLMLCAGLSSPDELHAPLGRMLQRRTLVGTCLGVPLHDTLLAALIENQIDSRLLPLWFDMLDGRPDAFLAGSAFDGFTGVSLMPASEADRGNPNQYALSEAIVKLARSLDAMPDRDRQMRHLVRRLPIYPDRKGWCALLMLTSTRQELPNWASVVLYQSMPEDAAADPAAYERALHRLCKVEPAAWSSYVGAVVPFCESDAPLEGIAHRLIQDASLSRIANDIDLIPEQQWPEASKLLSLAMRVHFDVVDDRRVRTPDAVSDISSYTSGVTVKCGSEVIPDQPRRPKAERRLYEMAYKYSDLPPTRQVLNRIRFQR
jgi:hypothetical protein